MSGDYLMVTDTERRTHLIRTAFINHIQSLARVDGYSYMPGYAIHLADGEWVKVYEGEGKRIIAALSEANDDR